MRGSDKYITEISVKDGDEKKEKYLQAGRFDKDIVCERCEERFLPFDTHGNKVLSEALSSRTISNDFVSNPKGYLIENAEYHKLKLFFLSMLWRAHASSLKFFSHVDLGPHEPILRSYIETSEAPPSHKYEIMLLHQTDSPVPLGLIPPWRCKLGGVNAYKFYLPEIVVVVNVDQRPFPKAFNSGVLKEIVPPRLILTPFIGSPEEKHIDRISRLL